jgi:hypothetical protein
MEMGISPLGFKSSARKNFGVRHRREIALFFRALTNASVAVLMIFL